ncbi:hypothetical protein A2U01_0049573, partial [Trifolium medium]|nr:hypothetical protein [Trifolium medium]
GGEVHQERDRQLLRVRYEAFGDRRLFEWLECQYMAERDAARKKLKGVGLKYNELKATFDDYKNKYALQVDLVKTLEEVEARLEGVIKERDSLLEQVKARNEQIANLEEGLKTADATAITEEEKKMGPDGAYAGFSRVDFVRTILDWQGSVVEVSSSQFRNVVAQIRLLNP